jgi:O-antigen/teichoic acid export membrane protein
VKRPPNGDVAVIAIGQILQQIIALATGIILARMLGSSGYGIVNLLRTLFLAIMTIAPLGLDLALLKYGGRHAPDAHHVRVTVNRLRLIAATVNIAVAIVIGVGFGGVLMRRVYPYPHFDTLLIVTLIGLPFAADLGIMGACYKSRGRPGVFALMTLYLQSVLRLVLVGMTAWIAPKLFVVVWINTAQVLVGSLVVITHDRFFAHRVQPSASAPVPWREAWAILGESGWMALSLLLYAMMRFVDILFLGIYVPAREVGAYAALSTIAQLVQVYPLAISQTLGPNVARHFHAGDLPGVRRVLGRFRAWASLVSGFMFGGIAAFGTRLDLIFGQSFHFGQDISVLMPLGTLLSAVLAPTGFALSMTGRHRAELAVLGFGGALLLLLCWTLIPRHGQTGAASAVAIAFFVINTIRFAYVAKVLGFVPGAWRDVLPPLLGLSLAFASRGLGDVFFTPTFAATAAACLVYGGLYAVICRIAFIHRS